MRVLKVEMAYLSHKSKQKVRPGGLYRALQDAPEESEALADFRVRISAAVGVALMFLKEDGAPTETLGSKVVVKRLPYKGAFGNDLNIQARANLFFPHEALARDKASLAKQTFKGCFGLELSEAAYRETEALILERLSSLEEKFVTENGEEADKEVDVFVYMNEEDVVPDWNYMESLLAHELWHLIENNEEVFRESDLIGEGTATNVQRHFLRQTSGRDLVSNGGNTLWQLMYFRSSELVEEELRKEEGVGLLNPELRSRVVARFQEELAPEYFALIAANTTDLDRKQFEDPAYADFRNEPTRENLLAALVKMGLPIRAQEFGQQDATRYLEWAQRLLLA